MREAIFSPNPLAENFPVRYTSNHSTKEAQNSALF
jgi:hypothetical protein